jgi:hypothetical protein
MTASNRLFNKMKDIFKEYIDPRIFDAYKALFFIAPYQFGGDDGLGVIPDSLKYFDYIKHIGMVINVDKQLRLLPNFTNYLQRNLFPVQALRLI